MRIRASVFVPAVVALAVLASGGGTASAGTLFTSSDYTARVPTSGSTAIFTSDSVTLTSGGTVVDSCTDGSLTASLSTNNDTSVTGTFTSGSFSGCDHTTTGSFPWSFSVNPTGTRSGTNELFTASLSGVGITYVDTITDPSGTTTFNSTPYSGTLGATVREPAAAGAPLCFVLSTGTVSGPLGNLTLSGTFCEIPSTTWTLGTTANASLWTNSAHVTRVPVGSTATMTSGAVQYLSGSAVIFTCASTTMNLTVTQNSIGLVKATVPSAAFSGCTPFPQAPTFPWTLKIGGTATISGTDRVFTDTRLLDYKYDLAGGTYNGNFAPALGSPLTTGVYASEPTAAGAPACLTFDHALGILGPLLANGQFTARYCPTGTAANWSLT